MQNEQNYEEISILEKRKIEDKFYFVKDLQNFRIEFFNFMGYLNITLPNNNKYYRFFL